MTKDEENTPSADEIQMGKFALGISSHSSKKKKKVVRIKAENLDKTAW